MLALVWAWPITEAQEPAAHHEIQVPQVTASKHDAHKGLRTEHELPENGNTQHDLNPIDREQPSPPVGVSRAAVHGWHRLVADQVGPVVTTTTRRDGCIVSSGRSSPGV